MSSRSCLPSLCSKCFHIWKSWFEDGGPGSEGRPPTAEAPHERSRVIGGTGLIGSAVLAYLSSRGHSVVPMSRSAARPTTDGVSVDLSKATSPSDQVAPACRHRSGRELRRRAAGHLGRIRRPWFIIKALPIFSQLASSFRSAGLSISRLSAWTVKRPAAFRERSSPATRR